MAYNHTSNSMWNLLHAGTLFCFQVGPELVVLGKEARQYGLSISLLERLKQRYQSFGQPSLQYSKVLTTNYRCHEAVTQFLSKLFYDNQLVSNCNPPRHPRAFYPFVFFCSDIERLVRAPREAAYDCEAKVILEQLGFYFDKWPRRWGSHSLNEIGIISPTRNQVCQCLCVSSHLNIVYGLQFLSSGEFD